ncbi:MAG: hypothetical protein ACOX0X_03095 [Candidatus Dojkabacteria bacterium]
MKKILLSILILSLFPIVSYAQQKDITLSELFAPSQVKAEEINQLDQIEKNRKEQIENQLGFTIPFYTDNPSYTITFTDPSPSKKGVEIEIDGKAFEVITSPYSLPSLGIGEHKLRFRFNDKDDNVQTLEYTIIVLPRSPIFKTPVVKDGVISLSGNGLANSEVILFLTSNTFNHTEIVDIDSTGSWSTEITPQDSLAEGIYTLIGLTRKNGFTSEISEPTIFEVGENSSLTSDTSNQKIYFSLDTLIKSDIQDTILNNIDLLYLLAIPFVLGILLTLLFRSVFGTKKGSDPTTKKIEEKIRENKNPNKEKTLRELFEQKGESKKEEKKESKDRVVSKEEFLKEYKEIDPDDKKGKEKPSPQINKSIKISLTSKKD